MHGIKRLTSVSAVLVVALATSIAPASAAGTTTRWVDSDGHAGPGSCNSSGHAFKHIQAAVNASDANDTVIVCPGTYVEQVTIQGNRDGLTLKSSTPFGATIKTPSALTGPLGFTFLILIDRVDDVMVRGFKTIVRTQAPCETADFTIVVLGSRRVQVRGNRLLAPGSGSGAACYQHNGIVLIDGTGPGTGSARSSSATIGFNEVRDAVFMAVGAAGIARQVNVDIVHNSVRAYFGDPPSGGSSGVASAHYGEFGVLLAGRARGTIRDNAIQGASSGPSHGATFFTGMGVVPQFVSASPFTNGPVEIRGNTIRRVVFGLYIEDADELNVHDNSLTNTHTAIRLEHGRGNTIRHNTVGAADLGIDVDSVSSVNVLRNNTVTGAGGSCSDASIGSGTAGTANTWTGNTTTQPSNPAGICTVAP